MRPALTPNGPGKSGRRTPTLLQDLGTVASLYGTVFWMMGQRLQRGPHWEQKLTAETVRAYEGSTVHDARRVERHHN